MSEPVIIGNATLYLGDCRDILPTLPKVDAVVTDPPYSEKTHAGHLAGTKLSGDGAERADLGYGFLSKNDVNLFADKFAQICDKWIVWITDHTLSFDISQALERNERYVFAPLPYYHPGRSVRLAGDGPSSWTDWIVVARTKSISKWGTLRGGYVASEGWNDKARMGGKPTRLMQLLINDYSKPNDIICDPFMGAGTTGVACAKEGRSFIGIEIDKKAFELACKRIDDAQRQGDLFIA